MNEDKIGINQENESRLRATGVVNLFESIRDEGVVTGGSGSVKVEVAGVEEVRVYMEFDWGLDGYRSIISASLKKDKLVIHAEGRDLVVESKGFSLADAVGFAIVHPTRGQFHPDVDRFSFGPGCDL